MLSLLNVKFSVASIIEKSQIKNLVDQFHMELKPGTVGVHADAAYVPWLTVSTRESTGQVAELGRRASFRGW